MSECCNDGVKGSYKPARKIVVPKAKLLMTIDERMIKNVAIKGITELGSLLGPNMFFFSSDEQYAKTFCEAMKDYPTLRANLLCAINKDATEFALFSCFKGKVNVSPNNFAIDKDVLPTFKDPELLFNFCDILDKNEISYIPLPLIDMLILKSISTVQPYDLLLAKHYLSQYTNAKKALTAEDIDLLFRIKETGMPTISDDYNERVYQFLKVERKLFSAYSH